MKVLQRIVALLTLIVLGIGVYGLPRLAQAYDPPNLPSDTYYVEEDWDQEVFLMERTG